MDARHPIPLTVVATLALVGCSGAQLPEPSGDPVACTAEQLTTLTSASGVPFPEDVASSGSVSFAPADIVDGLASECILTFDRDGVAASFAVLPGGEAALSEVESRLADLGAEPTVSDGHVSATVGDNTIVAAQFNLLTQETAGFDDTDDLIVVLSSPVAR